MMTTPSYDELEKQTQDYLLFFSILHLKPTDGDGKLHQLQALAVEAKRQFAALKEMHNNTHHQTSIQRKREREKYLTALNNYQTQLQKIRFRCMGYMTDLFQSERWESCGVLLNFLPLGPLRDYYQAILLKRYETQLQKWFERRDALSKLSMVDPAYSKEIAALQKELENPLFSESNLESYQQGKRAFINVNYPSYYLDEAHYLTAKYENNPEVLTQCSPEYVPATCGTALDFSEQKTAINLMAIQAAADQDYFPAQVFIAKRFLAFMASESKQDEHALFNSQEKIINAMIFTADLAYKNNIAELKQEIRKVKTTLETQNPHDNSQNFLTMISHYEKLRSQGVLHLPISQRRVDSPETFIPGANVWQEYSDDPFSSTSEASVIDSKVREYEALQSNHAAIASKQQKCQELKTVVSQWLSCAPLFAPKTRAIQDLSKKIQLEEQRLQLCRMASDEMISFRH